MSTTPFISAFMIPAASRTVDGEASFASRRRSRRGAARPDPLLEPGRVLLGLELVVPQLGADLLVLGGRDHPVEHPQDVLLHGERLVDVLDQLVLELFRCHQPPPPCRFRVSANRPNSRPRNVARPRKPSPSGSSSSTKPRKGAR